MKGCAHSVIERYTQHTKPFGYITSPLLEKHGVKHAFTRRSGGVSGGVYQSLNFATGAGTPADLWENVVQNHRIAAGLFGMQAEDICRSYQTHSTTVLPVDGAHKGVGIVTPPFENGVDGLVCAEKGVLLSVRGADCATILFYDTKQGIYGACHSGWRGTAGKIAAETVNAMVGLGASPKDIVAAIGPSARSCCYQVGVEVLDAFTAADDDFGACFNKTENGLYLNMQGAIELTLLKAGLRAENISDCGECTVCNGKHYFSHRRDGVLRGTMAAFITG